MAGPQTTTTLCKSCLHFQLHTFTKDASGRRGRPYDSVLASATGGCPFCQLVIRRNPSPGTDTSKAWFHLQLGQNHTKYESWPDQAGLKVNRLWVYTGQRLAVGPLGVEFYIAAEPGSPAASNHDVTGRYLGEDQSSKDHFPVIEQWIDNCLQHPRCRHTASGTVEINAREVDLPTRCVEVTETHVFLKETAGTKGSYIALSHRWNEETKRSKTTTQNYEERKTDCSGNNLPKLFEDTFTTARALKVRYVWIDSLCIIQSGDDGTDWKKEAVNMAQYYQQAYLVISRTAGSKDSGLFIPRSHNNPQEIVRLPYRDRTGVRRGYFYVYHRDDPAIAAYSKGVRRSELSSRGWIFQECFLSRRSLYYTDYGVFFECQTESPRNTDQESVNLSYGERDVFLPERIKAEFSVSNSNLDHLWYTLVEVYSKLELEKPEKDRILAISGVAREFRALVRASKAIGNRETTLTDAGLCSPPYVSGLWINDIHYGLLWQVKTAAPVIQTVSSVPSWSWASILAEVCWPSFPQPPVNSCRIVALLLDGIAYPLDESATWQQRRLGPRDSDCVVSPEILALCDVDRISGGLLVRGRLQAVVIRDHMLTLWTTGELGVVDELTGYIDASKAETRTRWRAVYSLRTLDFVAGWGSFEEATIQNQLNSYDGSIVLALHISTSQSFVPGFAMGQLGRRSKSYNVLYLDNLGPRRYRRVGVGRIFENDLITAFDKSEEVIIELV